MVKDIAKRAGIPGPNGIYIIPTEQANAFCAGRGPKHYVVACTEGILKILDKDELKGVLSHELSHAKNRDVLVATVAATIAGVISYLAQMAQFAAIFGGMGNNNNNNSGGMIEILVLAILTPIIAVIIQLSISRSREYMADQSGAKLLKDGKPLATALEKIDSSVKNTPMKFGNKAANSLFIENPFKGSSLTNLFSTHPPSAERIKKLREMKF